MFQQLNVAYASAGGGALNCGGQHVGVPHEQTDPRRSRLAIEHRRAVVLHDALVFHHHHFLADHEGFFLVVSHEDRSGAESVEQLVHFRTHFYPQGGVQRGERLVKQDDFGARHKRASQSHPLLLSARKLMRAAMLQTFQIHQRNCLFHDFTVAPLAVRQAIGHILENRHVREECQILKHHSDAPMADIHIGASSGEKLFAAPDLAFVGAFQAGDDPQQSGFAASAGTQQHQRGSSGHGKADVFQHGHRTERLPNALNREHGIGSGVRWGSDIGEDRSHSSMGLDGGGLCVGLTGDDRDSNWVSGLVKLRCAICLCDSLVCHSRHC